jgi:hypothetical protein
MNDAASSKSEKKWNRLEIARNLVGHHYRDHDDGVDVGRGKAGRNMRDGWGQGDGGWGNPFVIESCAKPHHHERETIEIVATREESVARFKELLVSRAEHDAEFRRRLAELAGKKLDCWCQQRGEFGPACHGEVLAAHAAFWAEKLNE